MRTPPYSIATTAAPPGSASSECAYRIVTLTAMLLILASLWVF